MQVVKLRQYKIIESDNALDFETTLNNIMKELASNAPEIDISVTAGFNAYISYCITEKIPETIADRFKLEGVSFTCGECPNCVRYKTKDGAIDKRTKRAMCSKRGHCFIDADACEWFYKQMTKPVEYDNA